MVDESWRPLDGLSWLSMTIEHAGFNDTVSGAIVAMGNAGLALLADREAHYAQRDVTDHVEVVSGKAPKGTVVTFVPSTAAEICPGCKAVVRQGYVDSVNSALQALGFDREVSGPGEAQMVRAWDAMARAIDVWRDAEPRLPELERDLLAFLDERKAVIRLSERRDAIATSALPIVVSGSLYRQIQSVAEHSITLSSRALRVLMDDPDLRRRSGYRDVDFEMATRDAAAGELAPRIARVDLTLHRGVLSVFEVNCDSPGGMFHMDLLLQRQMRYCRDFGIPIDFEAPTPTCDAVVDTLRSRWDAFRESHPHAETMPRGIAIVERDWKQWATRSEFEHFRRVLSEDLAPTQICEPEELSYEEGTGLVVSGQPVDLVYKRILWSHLADPDDATMVRAEKAIVHGNLSGHVAIVNSLGSRMTGNKLLMALLQDAESEDRFRASGLELDEVDRIVLARNMPLTRTWETQDEALIEKVMAAPEAFALKSFNGYGAREVIIGAQVEAPERRRTFRNLLSKGYIVQEIVPHGRTIAPVLNQHKVDWKPQNFILGAYVIGGRCVAVEAKWSATTPISMNSGASRTAVLPLITEPM
jgi:hypothetical protein